MLLLAAAAAETADAEAPAGGGVMKDCRAGVDAALFAAAADARGPSLIAKIDDEDRQRFLFCAALLTSNVRRRIGSIR